jgi:anti-sigma regulatory factor (Ser/Thr protein kinase)
VRAAILTARSLCRVYRSDPGEVARVRRDLAAYLGSILQADDVILIASELAANSVVHSSSKMFVMRCEIFSTYVWIESQDSGADWCPRLPDDRPHGTDLIELLAEEWDTERSTDGARITWARVARRGTTLRAPAADRTSPGSRCP